MTPESDHRRAASALRITLAALLCAYLGARPLIVSNPRSPVGVVVSQLMSAQLMPPGGATSVDIDATCAVSAGGAGRGGRRRAYPDYPDAVARGVGACCGRVEQRREEVLQQPGSEDVRAHLEFVALEGGGVSVGGEGGRGGGGAPYVRVGGPVGREHDPGIVPDDVEPRFEREEGERGGLHGVQVGEVEGEEAERAGGGGGSTFDGGDGGVGIGLRAAGDVDGCGFGVEDLGGRLVEGEKGGGDRGGGGLLYRARDQCRKNRQ